MPNQNLLTVKGERVAIVSGLRTPFARKDTGFKDAYATSLGTMVTNELLSRTAIERKEIEQLVFGQVIQQPDIPNPAREIAIALNMPHLQSYSISSSCLSGLQAIANVAGSIVSGSISAGIAGGADSISNAPLSISPRVLYNFKSIFAAETLDEKYRRFRQFSWRDFKPHSVNLKDFTTQMSVAEVSEQMAQDYKISREDQDEYARLSNQKAADAWKIGLLKEEVMPSFPHPYKDFVVSDTLVSAATRSRYYQRFSPLVNKDYATVTEANMPQPVDGAAAVLLMNESKAKNLGLTPLGYIRSYAITGNDIWQDMFAGATIASAQALDRAELQLQDMSFIDIHESSASQMLANIQFFESNEFAKKYLNRTACLGKIELDKLNHLGGSIAFGNPRAVTSLRTIIQSLYALKRQGGGLALVASSGLGGLGAAMVLESE
ncbi:acetyl-CoA C-acyltransferase [Actinobacillus equuli subsp. equuli]|uniref:acetyl-CoA C-acyltransferase n=1 Tax=Actinobacillus equuli TaxID=718 RepID=UPI0024416D23|nr:acetyl-CoA C-acyltransferase [Actinobacillus equuli]WGE56016.1 acetyl-CoA C-acyltransferase [Actinobacillus equuli subsp. equuli]WGE60112.1 acetyl-CoA C-acyltransferase [Actinobacillus equuli subsp. haemolyticus]WGE61241.1 acetyl-CoA C-acyltransferase [Actinobacillus equuli subsp. haemolyticus]WGE82346.1 acetyl-CoA C-acyltransferase [Actinobacillus equuli subsp. haemolyticus]